MLHPIRSPRSLSPAHQTDGYYDDIDEYSPVVSDIEDDDEKSKRKDDLDKDNNDILQKILNEQSASKCELEDENVSDQGEHDDADETKESTCVHLYCTLIVSYSLNLTIFSYFFWLFRKREGAKSSGHFREKENR